MADVTINGLTATMTPNQADEMEIQLAGGGNSRKAEIRNIQTTRIINVKTSGYTVNASDRGEVFTNSGASAAITAALPAATVDLEFTFVRTAAYEHRLDPNGSETIGDGGAGKYLALQTAGSVTLRCNVAGTWDVAHDSAGWNFEL